LRIRKVTSKSLLIACRRFLAKDPIVNVLPLGDLYVPLLKVSNVYCALEDNRVVGVGSIYRAYSAPSLVVGTATPEVKWALIKKTVSEIPKDFISLCSRDDANLFEEYSTILHSHFEQQMTTDCPKHAECGNTKAMKVGRNELESLNKFYVEHNSEAWTPIQFKAGPYYCIKHDDKIVSAAGVHIVTPQIAQLGNIITDEAYRNRGYGTACTAALATDLASTGRIISLFVRVDNAPAIHMYEKLGFLKRRDITFLVMQKNASQ
jgi:hypothetical protein